MNNIVKHKPRTWQKKSFEVIDRCISSDKNEIIPVNACVGSGKTNVAYEGYVRFIKAHKDERTFQMFVAPSINLNKQQAVGLREYLIASGLDKNEVDVFRNDCKCEGDKDMAALNIKKLSVNDRFLASAKHVIVVVCDESLWGFDKDSNGNESFPKFNNWISMFDWLQNQGFVFGTNAFDEAHNYQNKQMEMFGNEFYGSIAQTGELSIANEKIKCVTDYFKLVMLMSGTPFEYQKEITKQFSNNECECSPKVAIIEHWICKPTLNFVLGPKSSYVNGALAIIKKELEIGQNEVFNNRILFNFSGIDELQSVREALYKTGKVGIDFHIIGIHSNKIVNDANGVVIEFQPFIDSENVTNEKSREAVTELDSDVYFNDNLPVIVMQVDMISEGLNVSSFNAVVLTTKSSSRAMQQIGRALRNYTKNGVEKVDYNNGAPHGHANVYVFMETFKDSYQLMANLMEYKLTSDEFTWGGKLMLAGSGNPIDTELNPSWEDFKWDTITDLDIIEINMEANGKEAKRISNEIYKDLFTNTDEIENALMTAPSSWFKNNHSFGNFTFKSSDKNHSNVVKSRVTHEVNEDKFVDTEDAANKKLAQGNKAFIINIINTTKNALNYYPDMRNQLWINGNTKSRMMVFNLVVRNDHIAKIFAERLSDYCIKLLGGCY